MTWLRNAAFVVGCILQAVLGLSHLVAAAPVDFFPPEIVGPAVAQALDRPYIGVGDLLRSPRELFFALNVSFGVLNIGIGVLSLLVFASLTQAALSRAAAFLMALNAIMLALHAAYSPWPPIVMTGVVLIAYGIASALAPRQTQSH
jgi:hypothetical protein